MEKELAKTDVDFGIDESDMMILMMAFMMIVLAQLVGAGSNIGGEQ